MTLEEVPGAVGEGEVRRFVLFCRPNKFLRPEGLTILLCPCAPPLPRSELTARWESQRGGMCR